MTGAEDRAGAVTPRAALARVALAAALGTDGVVAGNPGRAGQYVTSHGGEVLRGVVAAPEPAERYSVDPGRYSVDLYLTAGLVPLHPLGERVRALVRTAADDTGLGDRLGHVTVTVLDVQPTVPVPVP